MNDIVNSLMSIENNIYNEFGVNSRPYGIKYMEMIFRMCQEITNNIDIDMLTPDVKQVLTCNNFHMVNHAIDLVHAIDKYSMREYENQNTTPLF
jgi:hypothetical protein